MLLARVVSNATGTGKPSAAAAGLGLLFQRNASSTPSARPVKITLLKAAAPIASFKGLELDYELGERLSFSAEFLRVHSLSADSVRVMASGKRRVISGRRHVHILDVEMVGKYGVRIVYDDTHDTGIYTWSYLHDLGSNKFQYMRKYIRSLQEQGLNRDPSKRNRQNF